MKLCKDCKHIIVPYIPNPSAPWCAMVTKGQPSMVTGSIAYASCDEARNSSTMCGSFAKHYEFNQSFYIVPFWKRVFG